MYDPVDLPSSKLPTLAVTDQVYRQMRDSVVPVMMNPLARVASQLIRYSDAYRRKRNRLLITVGL